MSDISICNILELSGHTVSGPCHPTFREAYLDNVHYCLCWFVPAQAMSQVMLGPGSLVNHGTSAEQVGTCWTRRVVVPSWLGFHWTRLNVKLFMLFWHLYPFVTHETFWPSKRIIVDPLKTVVFTRCANKNSLIFWKHLRTCHDNSAFFTYHVLCPRGQLPAAARWSRFRNPAPNSRTRTRPGHGFSWLIRTHLGPTGLHSETQCM